MIACYTLYSGFRLNMQAMPALLNLCLHPVNCNDTTGVRLCPRKPHTRNQQTMPSPAFTYPTYIICCMRPLQLRGGEEVTQGSGRTG